MKLIKIKPKATLVAQLVAGVEVHAVEHEGTLYIPMVDLGDLFTTSAPTLTDKLKEYTGDKPAAAAASVPKKEPERTVSSPSVKEAVAAEAKPAPAAKKPDIKQYTEKEMKEMDTDELNVILKKYGINHKDYPGVGTNRKLRDLVLKAQEGTLSGPGADEEEDKEEDLPMADHRKVSAKKVEDEPEEDDEEETAEEETDELTGKVAGILADLDAGEFNEKAAVKKLIALAEHEDDITSDVRDLVKEFTDDEAADIDAIAKKIANHLRPDAAEPDADEEEDEDEAEEGGEEEWEDTTFDKLKKGERVTIYWSNYDEWYDGKVKSIKDGKILIAYDDDTEEYINKKVHTRVQTWVGEEA